ncbi:MAG: reverse transcriptase domain-containing protein, partial [Candidatus Phytoplasma stylosanthis]|nr:reverse transcriptase domain-containing protein [Candidatus Phytoplasma stylosanthis]
MEFYNKLIDKSSNICRTTWKIISHETNCNSTNSHKNISLCSGGSRVDDPKFVSNMFNNYFTDLVDAKVKPNLKPILDNVDLPVFTEKSFIPSTINDIQLDKILMSFDNKNSTGYDDIPMTIIKFSKHQLIKPLCHVINSSIISGIFPDQLKIAKIKPLYKAESYHDVANYRPLSLLPIFSKIFERVMANQLITFLENNNLLDNEQFGFRTGKSVLNACIEFI